MVSSGLTLQRALWRSVLILFFLVPFSIVRAQSNEIAGTMPEDYLPELKEILKTALQRNPEVMAREFERLVQEAKLTQANASRYPSFGGNFNYGITQTATAGNTDTQSRDSGFFYNFGLSQAVFHWGALKNQRESARINLLVSEKSFAVAYRELSALLRKLYLSLIVEKARLLQQRESFRLAGEDM